MRNSERGGTYWTSSHTTNTRQAIRSETSRSSYWPSRTFTAMRRVATHGRICVASHTVPGPRAHHEEGCSVCAGRAGSSPHLYVPVGCAVAAVGDRWPHAAVHVVRPDHGNVHFQLIFPTPFFGFFLWQRMRNACMFNICELCN